MYIARLLVLRDELRRVEREIRELEEELRELREALGVLGGGVAKRVYRFFGPRLAIEVSCDEARSFVEERIAIVTRALERLRERKRDIERELRLLESRLLS